MLNRCLTCLLVLLGHLSSASASVLHASTVKRGKPLSDAQAKSVEDCLANSSALNGQTVKVQGEVQSVCQKKGCWFVLQGENGGHIRISAMGYQFFVPKNAKGMVATIEGQFEVKEIDAKLAQHYENDRVHGSSETAEKVNTPRKEYTIAATAVELHEK